MSVILMKDYEDKRCFLWNNIDLFYLKKQTGSMLTLMQCSHHAYGCFIKNAKYWHHVILIIHISHDVIFSSCLGGTEIHESEMKVWMYSSGHSVKITPLIHFLRLLCPWAQQRSILLPAHSLSLSLLSEQHYHILVAEATGLECLNFPVTSEPWVNRGDYHSVFCDKHSVTSACHNGCTLAF